ncbi:MAG TPA: hypothetical protein VFM68_00090 [Candidatus Saccharimonadales bacterium]|nr:hypothetical protein [Candidatus Saccharimonadales bacterium]
MAGERLSSSNGFGEDENYDNEQAILNQEIAPEEARKSHAFFGKFDKYKDDQEKLNEKCNFEEYFEKAIENPEVTRTAYQTVYRAITSREDFFKTGKNALYGAEEPTERFIEIMRAGAKGLEIGKRIILLAGPPGSGKSTLVNGTKRAIEEYSKTDEGAMYAIADCPMHEEPLHLIPKELREELKEEHGIQVDGDLCPACEENYGKAFNNPEVLKKVPIKRIAISEKKRVGIGTFKPSDPKSQDITELIGGVDYSQLGDHGSASDAKAYRFDGELNKANRGAMEFVEMLKSDPKFLYTLLDLTQDRVIKSPRFSNIHADEVILAHTNMAEYYDYRKNPKNEALNDRMVVIEVPYTLKVSEESKIHEKLIGQSDIAKDKVHISPKTYEMASTFGVLSRLKDGNKYKKIQKLKIYDDQETHDLTRRDFDEIKAEDKKAKAGMHGVSPRYIIDSLSMALSKNEGKECLNPMDAIKALKQNLDYHSHTSDLSETDKAAILEDISTVWREFNRQAEHDVKRAFVHSFDETAQNLCDNYLNHVEAYRNKTTIIDPATDQEYEPDERLMRSIEEQARISESGKDEYRKEIFINIGASARKGEKFDYTKYPRLKEAIQNKLFNDLQDVISLTTSASVPNKDQKERIEGVQKTMVEEQGYCEHCAHAIIKHVGNNLNKSKS